MAKKGISVRQLARELDLTSRQLIDRCRAEQIFVQNGITKLPPATERRVRALFLDAPSGGPEPPASI